MWESGACLRFGGGMKAGEKIPLDMVVAGSHFWGEGGDLWLSSKPPRP